MQSLTAVTIRKYLNIDSHLLCGFGCMLRIDLCSIPENNFDLLKISDIGIMHVFNHLSRCLTSHAILIHNIP